MTRDKARTTDATLLQRTRIEIAVSELESWSVAFRESSCKITTSNHSLTVCTGTAEQLSTDCNMNPRTSLLTAMTVMILPTAPVVHSPCHNLHTIHLTAYYRFSAPTIDSLSNLNLHLPKPARPSIMANRSLTSLLLLSLVFVLLLSPYLLSSATAQAKKKKLSDKELEDLEDQWFEDEEDDPEDLSHWKKGPDGQRHPPKRPAKSEMAFVALKKPITKDDTGKWASETADVLISGGVEVKGYAVETGKVLFVSDKGSPDMLKVKRFVLADDKVVDFEWNQKKYYPQTVDDEADSALDNMDIEALLAKARMQTAEQEAGGPPGGEKKGKAKKAKKSSDSAYLGGAGAPIPADFPDEL